MALKHILKRLVRTPLFTALTVLTLAIGIGANTAIFSVVEGILLQPLPFHSDELVAVEHTAPGVNLPNAGSAPFLYFTYRDEARVSRTSALWTTDTASLTGLAEPEEMHVDRRHPRRAADARRAAAPRPTVYGARRQGGAAADGDSDLRLLANEVRRRCIGWSVARSRSTAQPREVIGVLPESFRFLDTHPACSSRSSSIAARSSSGSSTSPRSRG